MQFQVAEFFLKDSYTVQIHYLMDIAEPAYEQLRTIHNKKFDEAEFDTQLKEQRFAPKK